MNNLYPIVTALCVGGAVALAAWLARRRAWPQRLGLGLAAAVIVTLVFTAARPEVERFAFERSDAYAWSVVRARLVAQDPVLLDVFALDPSIEAELSSGLLSVLRESRIGMDDPAILPAASKAAAAVYRAKVLPVAQRGSDEAVAAWGDGTAATLQAFRTVSDEACADYAMTGVNRTPPNLRVDAALSARQRAMVAAYRSSNPGSKLPSAEELGAAYEQARTLAEPPFEEADMAAFRDLKDQPKARQCDLMLRLFGAIDRLPLKQKAAIYRTIMANG
ncbi:hypothetical protein LJ725_25390 [Reyranella aquatilis]|uniref:Uncharacterized protein n=1 Tax=Reyranella aquatilis TaxID=2035356 RepID=A0ABS8L1V3_9HYPH|nr:hypothetical protein [Reyranella aquatilis]MCC8432323.1 hypothetical protein [Reyranella aquatilis]